MPAPQNAAIFNVRGVALYRADSTDPSLDVPSLTVAGIAAYPQAPRDGKAKLDGALWQRIVRAGNVYRVKDLSAVLWRTGVGTRALGGKGRDRPLSEERLREEFHALCWEALAPGGSDVLLPNGERGLGVCRSREEARKYAAHRRGRVRSQARSLAALARRAPLWFATSAEDRAAWAVPGQPHERVQRTLNALTEGEWKTNAQLTAAIFGPELDTEGEKRARALSRKAGAVRELVHDARAAGVPVIGSPAHGYRLARQMGDLQGYFEAERARMDAVEAGAVRVEQAAALWYPETEEEEATAANWRSKVRGSPTAPQTLRREKHRRARAEQSEREREATREQAAQRERELMAMPTWARVRHKHLAGQALTEDERGFERELAQQRKAKKTGRSPSPAKDIGRPRPAASLSRSRAAAVPPAPW